MDPAAGGPQKAGDVATNEPQATSNENHPLKDTAVTQHAPEDSADQVARETAEETIDVPTARPFREDVVMSTGAAGAPTAGTDQRQQDEGIHAAPTQAATTDNPSTERTAAQQPSREDSEVLPDAPPLVEASEHTPTALGSELYEEEQGNGQTSTDPALGRVSQSYQPLSQNYDAASSLHDQPVTWAGPEADSQESDDTDSALGSYASTRSTSLSNSAYDYRTFHGRRYHAYREGTEYLLPNDEPEMDRLDLQHHVFLMTLGGRLHAAPLRPDIQSALDVGTGTGIWAIDFADAHPACLVTGTDLSPIQPAYVPPNCRFYVEDAEGPAGWSFDAPLDYVHGRMLVVGIKNWRLFFQRAFAALAPGGWIELQDLNFPARCDDASAPPDSPLMRWSAHMMAGAARFGIDLAASNTFPALLAETGFTNIASETHAWPINRWPRDRRIKELATWVHQNFLQGLQGFSMAYFTRALGWSIEELEVHLAEVRTQARDRSSHVYMPISFFWAQKPLDA